MTSREVYLFADDTSVVIEGTNYDKIIDIVYKELELKNIWLRANKLTVNIKKTHYVMFHRTRIKFCGVVFVWWQ